MTCALNGSDMMTSSTTANSSTAVKFVTSLIVMRDGHRVASITEHTPPAVHQDLDNLKVKGQITGSSGFIHMTWTYPSDAQAGIYTCQSSGLTTGGHFVNLEVNVEVRVATPNCNDLVKYIGDQQRAIEDLRTAAIDQDKTIKDQIQEMSGLRTTIGAQEDEMKSIKRVNADQENQLFSLRSTINGQAYEILTLKSNISEQENLISSIKTSNTTFAQEITALKNTNTAQDEEIFNLRNVQSGIIDCGRSHTWGGSLPNPNGATDKYTTRTISFSRTYSRPPVVHLSTAFYNGDSSQPYFRTDLVTVSNTGFTMRCRVWHTETIGYMTVSWVSIPH